MIYWNRIIQNPLKTENMHKQNKTHVSEVG